MRRIGTITPSSNVIVEQVTQAIVADYAQVSAHFARLSYFGSTDRFPHSYDWDGMRDAARLLAHAHLDLLCWNGTKGGAIGFELDRELCSRVAAESGRGMYTSTLVLDDVLRAARSLRVAFVTPYAPEFLERLTGGWRAAGYEVVATAGAGLVDNYAYSTLDAGRLAGMARQVAAARPDAILFYCTNMLGAPLCAPLEAELGIPVYDSVSAPVWRILRELGFDTTASAPRWGSLFATGKPTLPSAAPSAGAGSHTNS